MRTRFSLPREKDALKVKLKGTQAQEDPTTKKKTQQVAKKTKRLAMKLKEPNTFE